MSGIRQKPQSAKQTKRENYRMNKTTKILLTISLTSFLASLSGALWGFFIPAGAVFFGLFMIFNLLAKETELFDEEQRMRVEQVAEITSNPQCSRQAQSLASFAAMSNQ